MKIEDFKIDDIVWFQAYEDSMPIQGRIIKKGSQIELGCGWDETDTRVFYALETLKARPFIFTRTTGKWLSKTKQNWVTFIEQEKKNDADYWERRRQVLEGLAMDNQSPLDSGEHGSY
jgi:hypothetical protein